MSSYCLSIIYFFFFKQNTAYEMRISDWSSDVCSSDLIALASGIAGGADVILIPEIPYTLDAVARKIADVRKRGRNFSLVVVAEAVKTQSGEDLPEFGAAGPPLPQYGGIGHYLQNRIAAATGAETRLTVLGQDRTRTRLNSSH